ncbi:PIH1 domain-containing protein 2 isoform X1 [Poecilia reticulata]|uniref:PIH1 domain-containing protein 2 isoform X1 n=1 Tax=Poecilia reticulata TaxID=8081 RepID=UPI0004A318A0|nr:PREDICTED: PIH1 domain-containing protein 2 isoform X1 [Poecilia reticulata]
MMSSTGGREDVLQQVSHFWAMLDDLSQSDPAAYRKFIEEQMKRGAEFNAPPELHSCVRTQILEPKPGLLYINICSWKRVPAPQDQSSSLPLCGGKLERCNGEDQGGCCFAVLDVALNPSVLQKRREDKVDINNIYMLALSFAQQQHGMSLSQEYSVVSRSPKGNPDDLQCRLGFQKLPIISKQLETTSQTPATLLRQISSSQRSEEDSAAQIICRPAEQTKANLIQVISSTFQGPQEPEYVMEVKSDAMGVPRSVELTVELPKVRSMSECQLRVSKEDVLLEVEDVYHLLLEFPKTVNEDTAAAVFNKKKRRLTLTAAIL